MRETDSMGCSGTRKACRETRIEPSDYVGHRVETSVVLTAGEDIQSFHVGKSSTQPDTLDAQIKA